MVEIASNSCQNMKWQGTLVGFYNHWGCTTYNCCSWPVIIQILEILKWFTNKSEITNCHSIIRRAVTEFTHYSTAYFIGRFFILTPNHALMPPIKVLPSGCVMLYYILEGQLCLQLQFVPFAQLCLQYKQEFLRPQQPGGEGEILTHIKLLHIRRLILQTFGEITLTGRTHRWVYLHRKYDTEWRRRIGTIKPTSRL
jgi:hypothetical protein